MSTHWYALHCKPHMEASVPGQLGFHQIELFYPTIQVRPVNPRSQKIKPYFPGYLFVHLVLGSTASAIIKWILGTYGLVCFDGCPALVPDTLITAIRQHVQKLNGKDYATPRFRRGEAVRVTEGVLAGLRGIFDLNLPGNECTHVLLKILGGKYTRVVLPTGFIEPIKQP